MATMGCGGAEHSLINLLEALDTARYKVDLLIFNPEGELISQVPSTVSILTPDRRLRFLSTNNKAVMLRNFSALAAGALIAYRLHLGAGGSNYVRCQKKWRYAYHDVIKPLPRHYDVAVAYMHSLPSYYVIDKVKADRKILWVHNDYSQLKGGKDFDRRFFDEADAIVTISEQCVKEIIKVFPEVTAKTRCIRNLIPDSKIRQKACEYIPQEYKEYKGEKLVSIGRLTRQKGFDYAIEAAKILKGRGIDFRWFIIGSGELQRDLQEQIVRFGVEDQVLLLGPRENPYPYLKGADVVVQTSRYEGKSIVLDEAKILCKPIVVTDYSSVRDQFIDDVNGKIVPINAEAIASGIASMIEDPKCCVLLSANLQREPSVFKTEIQKYYSVFIGEDIDG